MEKKTKKDIPRTLSGFTTFLAKEIIAQRKWMLFPIWVLLAAVTLLILLGGGSAILPAIYIAF